jgi:hypothetical protein
MFTKWHHLRTPGAGASFSPHSFYIFLPSQEIRSETLAGSPIDRTAVGATAAARHESTHWLQCFGTSVGQFLNHIRAAQLETIFAQLPGINRHAREALVQSRLHWPFRPIVRVTSKGAMAPSETTKDSDYIWFARLWYELILIEHLFSRSERQQFLMANDVPKHQIFADASADILLFHHSAYRNSSESEIRDLRKWYLPESVDGNLLDGQFLAMGEIFSSDDIMECAATLDQLCFFAILWDAGFEPEIRKIIHKIMYSLEHTRYGKPVRHLARYVPDIFDGLVEYVPTLLAMCDIALNPPLAPIAHPKISLSNHWRRWNNLSPPLRFAKLASAVPRVGLLRRGADGLELIHFMGDLCTAADVLNPFQYMQNPMDESQFEARTQAEQIAIRPDLRAEFSKYVGQKMIALRKVLPELFCYPSDTRQFSNVHRQIIDNKEHWKKYEICINAPLWSVGGRNVMFGIPPEKANWLITHSIHHSVVHQFVGGARKISLKNVVPAEALALLKNMNAGGVFDQIAGVNTIGLFDLINER